LYVAVNASLVFANSSWDVRQIPRLYWLRWGSQYQAHINAAITKVSRVPPLPRQPDQPDQLDQLDANEDESYADEEELKAQSGDPSGALSCNEVNILVCQGRLTLLGRVSLWLAKACFGLGKYTESETLLDRARSIGRVVQTRLETNVVFKSAELSAWFPPGQPRRHEPRWIAEAEKMKSNFAEQLLMSSSDELPTASAKRTNFDGHEHEWRTFCQQVAI
jgi:hypothetical protein